MPSLLNQEKGLFKKDLKMSVLYQHLMPKRGGLSYLVANLCLAAGFTPQKASIQSRKISQLQLVAANLGGRYCSCGVSTNLTCQCKTNTLWKIPYLFRKFYWSIESHDEIIQHCAEQIHQNVSILEVN